MISLGDWVARCRACGVLTAFAVSGCSGEPTPDRNLWLKAQAVSGSDRAQEVTTLPGGGPDLVIGDPRGNEPVDFFRVVGVGGAPVEGLVVVEEHGRIRRFTSAGRLLWEGAGTGDGPGEFRSVHWVGSCGGDSLFVSDLNKRAIEVLSPDGRYARSFVMSAPERTGRSEAFACNPGGEFLVGWRTFTREDAARREGPYRATVRLTLLDRDGALLTDLGSSPGSERFRFSASEGPRPLGLSLHIALSRNAAYVATGEQFEVLQIPLRGGEPRIIAWEGNHRRILPDDIRRLVEDDLAGAAAYANQSQLARRRQSWEAMPFPSMFPTVSQLLVDDQDRLWVRGFPSPMDMDVEWSVLGSDGDRELRVKVPADWEVLHVGGTKLVALIRDQDGVESVAIFPLERPDGQGTSSYGARGGVP